jgi:hypothetical protein
MYDFFKDFAGPMATVFAAAVAAIITFCFNRQQARIAATQRDIANDKLKADVFDRWYAIIDAAKELIAYAFAHSDFKKLDSTKVRALRVTIDEARFFFDRDIRSFLKEIDDAAEALFLGLADRETIGPRRDRDEPSADEDWAACLARIGDASKKLSQLHEQLPSRFERVMRLQRFTG